MHRSDDESIDTFIEDHNLESLRQELIDLCSSIYGSGWVDGSNDYIGLDEEE